MRDEEGSSENKVLEDSELENELSALVSKNTISSRIAEKLEQKLKKKQIKITKEQLHVLVDKIRNIMRTYSKFDSLDNENKTAMVGQPIEKKAEMDMKKLVDTIEKLQEKVNNIENGIINKDNKSLDETTKKTEIRHLGAKEEKISSPKIVTTEDIQVPEKITVPVQEWKLDPLSEIPSDPESIIVLMKWLQYLIDKCGRSHLPEILDYYVDIGWISEDVKISLIDYSSGITEHVKEGENAKNKVSDLPSREHIQSLLFIQKLKGRQFDKHFLDRIEGEISRISKKLDNYNYRLK